MNNNKLEFIGTYQLRTMDDTDRLAQQIATEFQSNPGERRWVLGLQGAMGAGKTYFVKALAKALGLGTHDTNSPTFAIHQQYEGGEVTLHHLDFYRLESEEEIESSGFWDLFYENNVLIAVEWIDRVDEATVPQNFIYRRLEWTLNPDGTREIKFWRRT